MKVSSYLFQSHYPNQVQIGRPDPQSVKDDENKKVQTANVTSKRTDAKTLGDYISQSKAQIFSADLLTVSQDNGALQSFQNAVLKLQADSAYNVS